MYPETLAYFSDSGNSTAAMVEGIFLKKWKCNTVWPAFWYVCLYTHIHIYTNIYGCILTLYILTVIFLSTVPIKTILFHSSRKTLETKDGIACQVALKCEDNTGW